MCKQGVIHRNPVVLPSLYLVNTARSLHLLPLVGLQPLPSTYRLGVKVRRLTDNDGSVPRSMLGEVKRREVVHDGVTPDRNVLLSPAVLDVRLVTLVL